jgi:nicotinamide riboside transporter PnuC
MLFYKTLGYIASVNTIISVWLCGNKSIWLWYLSIFNQCLWGIIGYLTGQYYLVLMAVCLQVLNIRGVYKWSKK